MKNKLIALGALSLITAASAVAQDEWSVTTSFTYETAYMFRGEKRAEHAYFPSVDVANGPFYAGVWAAFPIDNRTRNEVDIYAGYGFELSEIMSLDVGVTYYTYPSDANKLFDSNVNTLEFYTGLSFALPYSPAAYVYYDMDREALTFEVSAGHSIPMAENLTFDMGGAVGYVFLDDAPIGAEDEWAYAVATLGFGYAISEAASVSLYGSYSIASETYTFVRGNNIDRGKDEVWFGVSLTAGF